MREQWDELKETIIELRDNNGTATQQECCQFLANLMNVLEAQMAPARKKGKWILSYPPKPWQGMPRYIEAERFKLWLQENYVLYDGDRYFNDIDAQPTADVVSKELYDQVKYERDVLQEIVDNYEQWIPVSERLPEDEGWYLVTDDSGGVRWLEVEYYDTEFGMEPFCTVQNPVAWMPLPKPWKGESNA